VNGSDDDNVASLVNDAVLVDVADSDNDGVDVRVVETDSDGIRDFETVASPLTVAVGVRDADSVMDSDKVASMDTVGVGGSELVDVCTDVFVWVTVTVWLRDTAREVVDVGCTLTEAVVV